VRGRSGKPGGAAIGVGSSFCAVKSSGREEVQHEEVRGVVEDRAHGTDENHEPLDVADIPLSGHPAELRVHRVRGDADLGDVIEQIIGKDLDGKHGEERQEVASPHDAEHVAEIGARPHADVFDDVAEDFLPPADSHPSSSA
jgi:hypothetical protein